MKTNWTRKLLGGLSFTSALFVFQACYGTPQDFGLDLLVEGQVKAKSTGLPIKGIKVSVVDDVQYLFTDDNGRFGFYAERKEGLTLRFQDVDAVENGLYSNKDTVLAAISDRVYLDIELQESE
jgi:hypothetical protein